MLMSCHLLVFISFGSREADTLWFGAPPVGEIYRSTSLARFYYFRSVSFMD
jgi:hypothetical protein